MLWDELECSRRFHLLYLGLVNSRRQWRGSFRHSKIRLNSQNDHNSEVGSNRRIVLISVRDRLDLNQRVNGGETIPSPSASTAGYSTLDFGDADAETEISRLKPAR